MNRWTLEPAIILLPWIVTIVAVALVASVWMASTAEWFLAVVIALGILMWATVTAWTWIRNASGTH